MYRNMTLSRETPWPGRVGGFLRCRVPISVPLGGAKPGRMEPIGLATGS